MILPYRSVTQWTHQGPPDDRFGLCFYAMCGNHAVILGHDPMVEAEVENAAREMEGFNEWIKATDKGENLEVGFRYIHDRGWPGDPTLTIASWSQIGLEQLPATIASRGASETWLLLPMNADGTNYDWTDDALVRGAPGIYAHAVLAVDAASGLTVVTWGGLKTVSENWARTYLRGQYDVTWQDVA
jgi:hypothetical protein